MTREAFNKKIPPPEVVRGALLLGIAVGQSGMEEVNECPECRAQIDNIKNSIKTAAAQAVAAQRGQPPAEPQRALSPTPLKPAQPKPVQGASAPAPRPSEPGK